MPGSRTYLIVNANAGSVNHDETLTRSIRAFFPDAKLLFTNAEATARSLARQALEAGCDLLIAAGGDGTLHEVINGAAGRFTETCFGLLPLGTGNDFARSIDMPDQLAEALTTLSYRRTAALDVVRVSAPKRDFMLNVSACGFGAAVDQNMDEELKSRWGPLCYARSFFETLPALTSYKLRITLDDVDEITSDAYNVIVANGRHVAAGIPIAPEALLTDGLADLIVLPCLTVPQLALLASATLLGKHLANENLIVRRARKIVIRSEPPLPMNADGELLAPAKSVTFEVLPRALQFIVGSAPSAAP